MFRKLKAISTGLAVLFIIVNLCGCIALLAGTAGGVGTAFWLGGKLSDEVSAPYDRTVRAAKSALSSLRMEITKEAHTEEVTQIKSEYTDGSTVWIDIRPLTPGSSKIEIRVGARGNKSASTKILGKIKARL